MTEWGSKVCTHIWKQLVCPKWWCYRPDKRCKNCPFIDFWSKLIQKKMKQATKIKENWAECDTCIMCLIASFHQQAGEPLFLKTATWGIRTHWAMGFQTSYVDRRSAAITICPYDLEHIRGSPNFMKRD